MDEKLIKANTKLVDENKLLKSDIQLLIKYIKGDENTKKELQEEINSVIKSYEEL